MGSNEGERVQILELRIGRTPTYTLRDLKSSVTTSRGGAASNTKVWPGLKEWRS